MRRKKSILTIAIVLGLFAFTSCGNAQKQATEHDHANHDQMQSDQLMKDQAQKILTSYLTIKNALVETDGQTASAAAKTLLEAIGNSQEELIKKIRFDAEHINETKDAGHQRDHFNTLSDNIYELIKATSANEGAIYRQFCPMAFDNKGAYWLSADEEIRNPYFGDRMLRCGSVKEEL